MLFSLIAILAVALSACLLRPPPRQVVVSEETAASALSFAKMKIGAPYVWGARGPDEFDSSGIIVWAYRQVVPDLRFRLSHNRVYEDANHQTIYSYNFHPLPLEQITPGDLVYITDGSAEVTHGALFVQWIEPYRVMEFLDASSRLGYVSIQEWPVNEEVRGQTFVAAGRLKVVAE